MNKVPDIFLKGNKRLCFIFRKKTGDVFYEIEGTIGSIEFVAGAIPKMGKVIINKNRAGYSSSNVVEIDNSTITEYNNFVNNVQEYNYANEFAEKI